MRKSEQNMGTNMQKVDFALNLKEPYRIREAKTKQELVDARSGIKSEYKNGRYEKVYQHGFHQRDNLIGDRFHNNYMESLELAWANHHGVTMTPDIIWHTLLSEVVSIVKENPDNYASLFTTTPGEKQTIIIMEGGIEMPLDRLMRALNDRVPTDTRTFLPEFSTTTDRAMMARYASFADMVSPYYSYMMLSCGIPFVNVHGNAEDWHRIHSCWRQIGERIGTHPEYFTKVNDTLASIADNLYDRDLWLDMFRLERCGSGGDTEAYGWFSDLHRVIPSLRKSCNFSSHIAKVCYKQLDTNKNYEMYHGLFSSSLQDGCLVPEFGHMIYHIPEMK